MAQTILLVEDDPNFGMLLQDHLEMNGFEVKRATDGDAGWKMYLEQPYDLCVLDVMMPIKDGFTLAREIRKHKPDQPLIFLTAKSLKEDMLEGFRIGADDYLTKPFDTDVLMMKIKALLQRSTPNTIVERDVYTVGNYSYNTRLRVLTFPNGEDVKLSPKEGELLRLLIHHQNDLLPRSVALVKIWKDDNYFTGRSMDVYVAKLRKYLKEDARIEIQNVHSEGFILKING